MKYITVKCTGCNMLSAIPETTKIEKYDQPMCEVCGMPMIPTQATFIESDKPTEEL